MLENELFGLAVRVLVAYNASMMFRALASHASASAVVVASAFALGGCQFVLGIEDPLPLGPTDPNDPRFGCEAWDALHFEPCDIAAPDGPLTLTEPSYRYDTDRQELDDDRALVEHVSQVLTIGGDEFVLISTSVFTIAPGTELRVVGSRGLMVASWGELVMSGVIDVSSTLGDPGAGSRTDCTADTGDSASSGSGGGGGGGYGGGGGSGGDGDSDSRFGGAGGDSLEPPDMPHGGCAGGGAGTVDGGVMPALGGPGGGVIHLSARGAIQIAGTIDAGGAGGSGGEVDGGGGGGGSGGCISLDGATIAVQEPAVLVANGGAGGEGGDSDDLGTAGEDGPRSASPAAGGRGATPNGGNGGVGGHGDAPDGGPGLNSAFQDGGGGGGGGGGVGYIVARGGSIDTSTAMVISPPLRSEPLD